MIRVENDNRLRDLQINHLVAIQSSKIDQHLVGIVSKIVRKSAQTEFDFKASCDLSFNIIKVILIGTHFDNEGLKENVFRRTLSTVPTINAECYLIQGDLLKNFMQAISSIPIEDGVVSLQIGNYTIDEDATAWLNGNKLFQRHAVIVGSTGSGKSWCVARILEQVSAFKSADAILFDIHGEYAPHIYEEMLSLMLDRSDSNAPNQAMMFSNAVIDGKIAFLNSIQGDDMAGNITLDSPVPYDLNTVLSFLIIKIQKWYKGLEERNKVPTSVN